jgi:putative membrane protein
MRATGMHDPSEREGDPSRSELAEDRTILANERTFGSWMRTSLGCVAIGVGFQGLFSAMQPPWVPRAIATAFLVLAVLVIVLAERRAAAVLQRLSAHAIITAKVIYLRLFAILISAGAVALAVAIWTVEIHPSSDRARDSERSSPIVRK